MNDHQNDETIEIDPDHPWHAAALSQIQPGPLPTAMGLIPTMIQLPQGPQMAAQLEVTCPNGAFVFFIPPPQVAQLMESCGRVLQEFQKAQAGAFQIASPSDMKDIGKMFQQQQAMKGGPHGSKG